MNVFALAARQYAGRGWHVFPCSAGTKVPATSHGLHDASTDPDVIRAWWQRWPRANVAIRTGAVSGLVVLDVDMPDGFASLEGLEAKHGRLPVTYTVTTPSGGEHYYYRHPGGTVPNSAGKLGAGLDVRGDGGYIVAPSSRLADGGNYRVHVSADLEPWPSDLLEIVPERPIPRFLPAGGRRIGVLPGGKYARAALEGEVEKVRSAPIGSRNHTLNAAAFALGQLVAAGALDAEPAVGALLHAAQAAGLGQREAERTIVSGLRAGACKPRSPVAS
jgi:Bifunctional DNA primase/polymerase, N-terminal